MNNRTVLQDAHLTVWCEQSLCRAEDSPVCICEMGRTSNNYRNCCTLGVRARRMTYFFDSAIGWYVWKVNEVTVRFTSAREKTRTVNVMKPVRDNMSFRRDGSAIWYSK